MIGERSHFEVNQRRFGQGSKRVGETFDERLAFAVSERIVVHHLKAAYDDERRRERFELFGKLIERAELRIVNVAVKIEAIGSRRCEASPLVCCVILDAQMHVVFFDEIGGKFDGWRKRDVGRQLAHPRAKENVTAFVSKSSSHCSSIAPKDRVR